MYPFVGLAKKKSSIEPMRFRHIALFTIFLGIFSLAEAQENGSENVNVTWSAISLSRNISGLKYVSGNEVRKLDVFRGARTKKVTYRGSEVIYFFRQQGSGNDPDDAENRKIVGAVTLPNTSGNFLFLFSKSPKADYTYDITAIPDDLATFKPGMYRFINLAPFDIAIQLGDQRKLIKHMNYTDISAKAEHNSYQQTVMLSLTKQGAKPFRSYEGNLKYLEDQRIIYIISPRKGGRPGRIALTAIPERIVPETSNDAG
ncbi:MAG: hypothetical protein AAF065_11395 [Verrucomicrobiota bacterium]